MTTEIDFAGSFKYADRTLPAAQIQGFSPGWTNTDGGDINPGRSFTLQENASGAHVVIINDKMAERLFPFGGPVGKSITINNSPYEVIGLYHYHPSFFVRWASGHSRSSRSRPCCVISRPRRATRS